MTFLPSKARERRGGRLGGPGGCRGHDRGASTVELAVVIPLLLIVIVGTVDLGRAVTASSGLSYAVREGARFAAVRSSESDDPATADEIVRLVEEQAAALPEDGLDIAVSWNPSNIPGAMVEVVGTFEFDPILPLIGVERLSLRSTGRMRVVY